MQRCVTSAWLGFRGIEAYLGGLGLGMSAYHSFQLMLHRNETSALGENLGAHRSVRSRQGRRCGQPVRGSGSDGLPGLLGFRGLRVEGLGFRV